MFPRHVFSHSFLRPLALAAILCSSGAASLAAAPAWNYRVLHTQTGPADGLTPVASLVEGSDGNFYGTTSAGGPCNNGTIFQQTPAGVLTTLYSFTGGSDGGVPEGSLVLGGDGNFYGTASTGGASNSGTIFKVTPAGVLTTLYAFTGGSDGLSPEAGLVQGGDGNFYGVTAYYGEPEFGAGAFGSGTVFRVTPDGVLTTLHRFSESGDGALPQAALVQGGDGNFYGTTAYGGTDDAGTVFRITPAGAYTELYSFSTQMGGNMPRASLVQGGDGNFYGTTSSGGEAAEGGTVFKITPDGTLTTLGTFTFDNGANPYGGLAMGADGNFYGTTTYANPGSDGTIFKITPDGTLTTVYQFSGSDGRTPKAALVLGRDGNFYGTTAYGGNADAGTTFVLSAAGA
ncbi:MAG: hypothetical protein INR65_18695, partial [Gluconacetobacter diazotrophicus]|nr:hypothetical protein [Gluconacetobacter diazotrophicus]